MDDKFQYTMLFDGNYSIVPVCRSDDTGFYWIVRRGGYILNKEEVKQFLNEIARSFDIISEEYISEKNKRKFLYFDEDSFLEKYGENDPLWIEHTEKKREESQKPPKEKDKIKGHIYFIKCLNTGLCKIGYSSDVETRIKNIKNSSPTELHLIGVLESNDCVDDEKHYKVIFEHKNVKGEWFELEPQDFKNIGLIK